MVPGDITNIGRYVSKSASTAYAEQEAAKLAELDDLYEYEESGSGCRPCQPESPRFFFADTQEEDMNDLPCCSEDNSELPDTVTATRRLSNATNCGRKRLNRILGGVVSGDNEVRQSFLKVFLTINVL